MCMFCLSFFVLLWFFFWPFDLCVVCSSIYGFWLPRCYLQTLLIKNRESSMKETSYVCLMQLAYHSPGSCVFTSIGVRLVMTYYLYWLHNIVSAHTMMITKSLIISNGYLSIEYRRTNNAMVARKLTTWLTMICKTLHTKLRIEHHKPYGKQWMKSGAPER